MVWYVPPLSPIQPPRRSRRARRRSAACRTCSQLRIPLRYLANLLTAGDDAPVARRAGTDAGDARLHARARHVDGVDATDAVAEQVGLTGADGRGHVPHPGDRQLRGPLRHPDDAPRIRRERLRPARRLRLLASATAARAARPAFSLFGDTKRKTADGGGVMALHLARPGGAALLSRREELQAALPARSPRCWPSEGSLPGAQLARARRPAGASCRATTSTTLQERYVALFDRSRSLSLHLFEHVHGESRDRGQAMVDLLAALRRARAGARRRRAAGLPAAVPGIPLAAARRRGARAARRTGRHSARPCATGSPRATAAYAAVFQCARWPMAEAPARGRARHRAGRPGRPRRARRGLGGSRRALRPRRARPTVAAPSG